MCTILDAKVQKWRRYNIFSYWETMNNYQSDSLTSLIPALTKAQSKFDIAEKTNKKSPGGGQKWKYANWPTIVEASRKALAENKLCVSQRIMIDNGQMILCTTLFHDSGEYLESRILLWVASNATAQDIGSRITFFKRYTYMALIGVIDEEDDDGELDKIATQQYNNERKAKPAPVYNKPQEVVVEEKNDAISADQLRELNRTIEGTHPSLLQSILNTYKILALEQLPRTKYEYVIDRVRERKQAEQGK